MARAEVERDAACHEASMACMDAAVVGNSKTQVESKLARYKTPYHFLKRLGGRLKTRLAV